MEIYKLLFLLICAEQCFVFETATKKQDHKIRFSLLKLTGCCNKCFCRFSWTSWNPLRMRGLTFFLVVILVCGLVVGSATADDASQVAHLRVRRGFGCPLNQGACHRHCRSIRRRGGYCSGIIKQTCTCYKSWFVSQGAYTIWNTGSQRHDEICIMPFPFIISCSGETLYSVSMLTPRVTSRSKESVMRWDNKNDCLSFD